MVAVCCAIRDYDEALRKADFGRTCRRSSVHVRHHGGTIMQITKLAVVVSSVLIGAAATHADDHKTVSHRQFKAADRNEDGLLSAVEATAGLPTLGKHFKDIDANSDG